MKQIWKFPLRIASALVQEISIPEGFYFLTIQMQGSQACLWATVDPSRPVEKLKIACLGTGWDIEEDSIGSYLGTVQWDGFVWHYFLSHK